MVPFTMHRSFCFNAYNFWDLFPHDSEINPMHINVTTVNYIYRKHSHFKFNNALSKLFNCIHTCGPHCSAIRGTYLIFTPFKPDLKWTVRINHLQKFKSKAWHYLLSSELIEVIWILWNATSPHFKFRNCVTQFWVIDDIQFTWKESLLKSECSLIRRMKLHCIIAKPTALELSRISCKDVFTCL